MRTKHLDVQIITNVSRPEEQSVKRFFIQLQKSIKTNNQYGPLQASSIASLLKAELQSVGVDITKFQAHIIRSSSMKLAIGGGKPEDQVLRTAQVSQKVFSDFYNLPLVDATSEPENMLGAAAADCLMDASVPELTGTNAQTNMGEADSDNTSAGDYSSITSLGVINDS